MPPATPMFNPPLAASLNHLLRANAWARTALQPHASKAACFRCPPFEARLTVLDSGEVAAAAAGAAPAAGFGM